VASWDYTVWAWSKDHALLHFIHFWIPACARLGYATARRAGMTKKIAGHRARHASLAMRAGAHDDN